MKTQTIIIIIIVVLVIIIGIWLISSPQQQFSLSGGDSIANITNDLNQVPSDSAPNQGLDSLNQNIQNF